MKKELFLILILVLYPGLIKGQDTIFTKSRGIIPAVIISKNNSVIKYKKSGQQESAAVYSVFLSDIESIHYADGTKADYTKTDEGSEKIKTAYDLAGNYGIGKISLGIGSGFFLRNMSDNLDEFWKNQAGQGSPALGGNLTCYPVELKMSFVTSQSRRHWVASGLEIFKRPGNSIYASDNDRVNEISIGASYMSVFLYYGYAVNNRKNLVTVLQPGVDFVFMDGYIKTNNIKHDLFSGMRTGMHIATGFDWIFSRTFHGNLRIGYRVSKEFKEIHFDTASPTGLSTYYVGNNPVIIKWNGLYASIGISASFYFRADRGRPDNSTIKK